MTKREIDLTRAAASERGIPDRIERLRRRLEEVEQPGPQARALVGVIKGILDLLGDEL